MGGAQFEQSSGMGGEAVVDPAKIVDNIVETAGQTQAPILLTLNGLLESAEEAAGT